MAMTVIWTGMTALSLLCALVLGNQGGWPRRPWRGGLGH